MKPQGGRDLDRDTQAVTDAMRGQPGIVEVQPYSREQSAQLLEPWLGTGLSLDDPPVPRVIVARGAPGTGLRYRRLAQAGDAGLPSASVDDHRAWVERMRSMTSAPVLAGLGILALVIIATIISVSFATRGAMAANRPIVEVLHFVGAGDRYIASRFLRHFLRLGLQGGIHWRRCRDADVRVFRVDRELVSGTPVGDQFAALLGTFSLRSSGYLAVAGQALLIAGITAWASRRTLFSTLNDIE